MTENVPKDNLSIVKLSKYGVPIFKDNREKYREKIPHKKPKIHLFGKKLVTNDNHSNHVNNHVDSSTSLYKTSINNSIIDSAINGTDLNLNNLPSLSMSKLKIDTSRGFSSARSQRSQNTARNSSPTSFSTIEELEEEESPVLMPITDPNDFPSELQSMFVDNDIKDPNLIIDSNNIGTSHDEQIASSTNEFRALHTYSPLAVFEYPTPYDSEIKEYPEDQDPEFENEVIHYALHMPVQTPYEYMREIKNQDTSEKELHPIPSRKLITGNSKPSLMIVIDSESKPYESRNNSPKANSPSENNNTQSSNTPKKSKNSCFPIFNLIRNAFNRFKKKKQKSYITDIEMVRSLSQMGEMSACSSVSIAKSVSMDGFLAHKFYGFNSGKYVQDRITQEEFIHKKMKHPNIVQLVGKGEDNSLIFEYIDGQTLKSYITTNNPLPIEEIYRISKEILLGLHYIHSKGYVHGDFKSSNILLQKPDNTVKICDFGASMYVGKRIFKEATSENLRMGTPLYSAPETIIPDKNGKYKISKASDIFQFGLILYEMITGTSPFFEIGLDSYSVFDVINKLQNIYSTGDGPFIPTPRDNQIDTQILDIFYRCIIVDYRFRPTALELLSMLPKVKSILSSISGNSRTDTDESHGNETSSTTTSGNCNSDPNAHSDIPNTHSDIPNAHSDIPN